MIKKWIDSTAVRPYAGLTIVRIMVALLLSVHAIHGLSDPNALAGFGKYLGSIGFPLGVALAWAIVLLQLTCSLLLVFGKLVVPACIGHIAILGPGIALDHARKGWFVVGPGKGGMEYSVLLIACLIAVLYAYWPWQNPRPVLKPSK